MQILAIDLGSTSTRPTKSFVSVLDMTTGEITRTSVPTSADGLLSVIGAHRPDRVVLEQTVGTGWVVDLARGAGVSEVQVVNPRDEAWCNRTVKTDRRDADLLAKLSASGQLRTVQVPDARVRQWRVLIDYRCTLVQRRTRLKNHLKAILRNQGLPTGKLWTSEGMARLRSLSRSMDGCPVDALWRGELAIELAQFDEIEGHLRSVTKRLDALVQICPMAKELLGQSGIGERTAEIVVATIDDPLRFQNRKQVGAYFGVVPRVSQSGGSRRHGGITKAGDRLARAILTQAVQGALARKSGWLYDIYLKLHHAHERSPNRAVQATVRRAVVILWAKCRDYRRAHPTEALLDIRSAA